MSGDGGDKGRVSPFAVAAGAVLVLGFAGMVAYAVYVSILIVAAYWYLCAKHQMAKCTRCEGGKIWNGKRTHFGWCGKCEGKGFHVRWGRRMWDRRVKGE